MKRLILFGAALMLACLPAQSQEPMKLNVGMVSAIDMLAIPVALERGFFEKRGLDATIARPYATGVDALNALQAGETDIVQVGVPMIGAVLRGMDLVALGNFSGNPTKTGSDATMAVIAREGSGIVKGDLASLKGKKIAASFGTINHLYILAILEKAGLKPEDVTLVNTPPPDMTVALLAKGIDAFAGWDPWPIIAQKDVPGAFEVVRGGNLIAYLGFAVALRPWVEKNQETVAEIPGRHLGSRSVDAQEFEAGGGNRHPLDSRPQARSGGGCDAVQRPATGPAAIRQQLPRALERAGPTQPAGHSEDHIRRQQAHRTEAHPEGHEGQPRTVRRFAADPGGCRHRTGICVQAVVVSIRPGLTRFNHLRLATYRSPACCPGVRPGRHLPSSIMMASSGQLARAM